jgi:uncharacterized membrane protein
MYNARHGIMVYITGEIKNMLGNKLKTGGVILTLLAFLAVAAVTMLPGSALAQEEKADLTLRLIPGNYDQKVVPGEENILHLEIHNQSSTTISNIRITPEPPKDWEVGVVPASISNLTAGAFQTVDITVTPPKNATRDYYQVNFVVDSSGRREIITAYLRVDTAASLWTWVGIGIGVIVIAGFVLIYRRFGRD